MEKKMICKCDEDKSKQHAFRRDGEGGFSGNKPVFSHAHYVAIGNILKRYIRSDDGGEIFNEFVRIFEEDNNKFDRDGFVDFVEGRRKN